MGGPGDAVAGPGASGPKRKTTARWAGGGPGGRRQRPSFAAGAARHATWWVEQHQARRSADHSNIEEASPAAHENGSATPDALVGVIAAAVLVDVAVVAFVVDVVVVDLVVVEVVVEVDAVVVDLVVVDVDTVVVHPRR